MVDRIIKKFLLCASIVIFASALVPFANLLHGTLASRMLLEAKDNFFGLQVRDELWILAIAKLLVGAALLLLKDSATRFGMLAWAMTNYFVLKLALVSQGIPLQKTFIGSLSDPLHLAHGWPGKIISIIPWYLLLGSYFGLAWLAWRHWQETRRNVAKAQTGKDGFWKISCAVCGGHVKFPLKNEGREIPCPHCAKPMKLRREENLKMSCFFCQGHIAFPAHALGTKMPCPHCHQDITLREPV